jgi:ornithine--oxo-acid transaminase
VLVKDTHGCTLRFAPPLVITTDEIDWAVDQLAAALAEAHNPSDRAG